MKRNASVAILLLFLLLGLGFLLLRITGVRAQVDHSKFVAVALQPPTATPTPVVAQTVPPTLVNYSLNCAGCHGSGKTLPYMGGTQFHTDAHRVHDNSQHARVLQNGKPAASCLDCHSVNGDMATMFPSSDQRSTVNRLNLTKTCGQCHEQPSNTFHASIHGQGQARGIDVSANCADCHGSHNIFPASDARSLLSKANTPATCAKCHTTILNDYETSSHGIALKHGRENAPSCTTCHTSVSHTKAPDNLRDFNLQLSQECSKCHERQAPSYRDTFHGQAAALGFQEAASCADCHTPHRNLPATDPLSSVHEGNLIQTCGKCHQNASASFVTYDPHAEPENPQRSLLVYSVYTSMNLLLTFVFGFFGLHTLLWLQRSIVGMVRGETKRIRDDEQWVIRFTKPHRITHIIIVISFLVLAATGLPLMFHYTRWGQTLAWLLGGVGTSRALHRIFGVVTFGYAFYHLGYLIWRWIKGDRLLSGPESMVPRPKDLTDMYRMVRWFLYIDKQPPRLDRWTYWEKFDYFAVFWGVPIIGLSGLMLWLPGLVTKFLPGVWLNVALIVHADEALLAVGFIFSFHFFHNHMRPENFPLDTVIFTGKLPLKRFEEERAEEYHRLVEEGRLDEVLTSPPTPRARLLASIFGYTTFTIGTILIIAIFSTLILR